MTGSLDLGDVIAERGLHRSSLPSVLVALWVERVDVTDATVKRKITDFTARRKMRREVWHSPESLPAVHRPRGLYRHAAKPAAQSAGGETSGEKSDYIGIKTICCSAKYRTSINSVEIET